MIPRYSRPEMTAIWEPATKFKIWYEIEAYACDAQAAIGVIPVWIGLKLGGKIRRRLAPEIFRKLVIYMLMASGVLLLVRAV